MQLVSGLGRAFIIVAGVQNNFQGKNLSS